MCVSHSSLCFPRLGVSPPAVQVFVNAETADPRPTDKTVSQAGKYSCTVDGLPPPLARRHCFAELYRLCRPSRAQDISCISSAHERAHKGAHSSSGVSRHQSQVSRNSVMRGGVTQVGDGLVDLGHGHVKPKALDHVADLLDAGIDVAVEAVEEQAWLVVCPRATGWWCGPRTRQRERPA
eukprot:6724614-Prymnesium_polylepis.1